MSRFARTLLVMSVALLCGAHVGSPDAWYDGPAGPYHVLVHVKAPDVVPGIAVISIKPDGVVDTISAFVNKFDAVEGGPPPDVAAPVADNPGWYRTQLWVMSPGSNSVTVSVHGAKGHATVVVPLVAVAARRLQFNGVLTAVLGAAGLILIAGLLTVIGAAVRESVLPPGETPDSSRRKRARFAMLRGAVVLVLVLSGMAVWWRAEDAAFAQSMFRPLASTARTETVPDSGKRLVFTITDSAWAGRNRPRNMRARGGSEYTTLVQDHEKLMHVFVVAENGSGNFAHLHPVTADSVSFTSLLPPLPAGKYRVFADVLHASGFTQTLTASFELESDRAAAASGIASASTHEVRLTDSDDAWIADAELNAGAAAKLASGAKLGAASVNTATPISAKLSSATPNPPTHKSATLGAPTHNAATLIAPTLTWLGATAVHRAGEQAGLRFRLDRVPGDTAALEPYLGMLGHAAVVRDDGAVFIHLHPMGTVSMGAQQVLSPAGHEMPGMSMPETSAAGKPPTGDSLYFPYAFPSAGKYTVWVQVKLSGQVLTAAYRVEVQSESGRKSP